MEATFGAKSSLEVTFGAKFSLKVTFGAKSSLKVTFGAQVAAAVEKTFAEMYTKGDLERAKRQLRYLHRLGLENSGYIGTLI